MRFIQNSGLGCLKAALLYELRKTRYECRDRSAPVPVIYDGVKLVDVAYRIDLLIEDELVVESKALDGISPKHQAQLLTYLKHSNRRPGLRLNFNEPYLRDGICRKVNRL